VSASKAIALGQALAYVEDNKTPQATGSDAELNTGGFLFVRSPTA
jgi:hypothetical protein